MNKNLFRKNFALYVTIVLLGVASIGIGYSYNQSNIQEKELDYIKTLEEKPQAVLNQTEFDWGAIPRGKIATQQFILRNNGQAEMKITKMVTSCGCTTAELLVNDRKAEIPGVIPPNSDTIVSVRFDPDAHDSRGKVKRAVRIETNDPENPFLVINLYADVQ